MKATTLTISIKESGKFKEVGKLEYFLPLLADFGISAEHAADEKGQPVLTDDGLPVYKRPEDNFIQSALVAATKVLVRNRIDNATATVKPGMVIPSTVAQLVEETERTGNGAALVVIANAKKDFAAWVASLGKSANAQALLNQLFANKNSLALQSPDNKGKMLGYISDFAASLEAAKLEAYQRYLESLMAVCQSSTEAEDF